MKCAWVVVIGGLVACGKAEDQKQAGKDFVRAGRDVARAGLELHELVEHSRGDEQLPIEATGLIAARSTYAAQSVREQRLPPETSELAVCQKEWSAASTALVTALGPVLEVATPFLERKPKASENGISELFKISMEWSRVEKTVDAKLCDLVNAAKTCTGALASLKLEETDFMPFSLLSMKSCP
jgi:hypothetical protein